MIAPLLTSLLLAAALPRVVVLPFENQTQDPELAYFQRGLADMVAVDLVNSGSVEVYERARLESVLDEQKLQRSKFFDPSTAVKVGRLVGATHLLSGVMLELGDKLRLSVQLLDVRDGKVLVAKDVSGPRADVFELEAALVRLFLEGLTLTVPLVTKPSAPTPLSTVATYGRAVELADQGQLTAAAGKLDALARSNPAFTLSASRKAELARRIRLAGDSRATALEALRRQLIERASTEVTASERIVKLPEFRAARRLTYRVIRLQCLALSIRARLTPKNPPSIPDGREAELRAWLEAYAVDLEQLAQELTEWRGPFKWLPDPQDKEALERLGLTGSPSELVTSDVVAIVRRWQGELMLNGRFAPTPATAFTMRPTLAELDPKYLELGRQRYAEALDGFSKLNTKQKPEALQIETLDLEGSGLLILGNTELATQRWQTALERFPKADAYPTIEAKVQRALELSTQGLIEGKERRALTKAVAACKDGEGLAVALAPIVQRQGTEAGAWGAKQVIAEVVSGCPRLAPVAWRQGLAWADQTSDCGWFDRQLQAWRRVDAAGANAAEASFSTCSLASEQAAPRAVGTSHASPD